MMHMPEATPAWGALGNEGLCSVWAAPPTRVPEPPASSHLGRGELIELLMGSCLCAWVLAVGAPTWHRSHAGGSPHSRDGTAVGILLLSNQLVERTRYSFLNCTLF